MVVPAVGVERLSERPVAVGLGSRSAEVGAPLSGVGALAQQLLEWLATDGQSAFVDGNHEYPANPAVAPETLIATTFGEDFVGDDLNAAEFGALNADAVRLLDEAGYR